MRMSEPPIRNVLVGSYGVPPDLEEAMRRHGVDPRAAFVDSAEGWRAGPLILEERSREVDAVALAREVLELAGPADAPEAAAEPEDEPDGQADAPADPADPGA
jgi:hypothetical protein